MHLAKGLEFRAVAVMACDDEVIPLQERIEAIKILASVVEETKVVGEWLRARTSEGVQPREVAVFVRSSAELERARAPGRLSIAFHIGSYVSHEKRYASDGSVHRLFRFSRRHSSQLTQFIE
jgi:hypothetical protein